MNIFLTQIPSILIESEMHAFDEGDVKNEVLHYNTRENDYHYNELYYNNDHCNFDNSDQSHSYFYKECCLWHCEQMINLDDFSMFDYENVRKNSLRNVYNAFSGYQHVDIIQQHLENILI